MVHDLEVNQSSNSYRRATHLAGWEVAHGVGPRLGGRRRDLLGHRADEALNLLPAAAGDRLLRVVLLGCTSTTPVPLLRQTWGLSTIQAIPLIEQAEHSDVT